MAIDLDSGDGLFDRLGVLAGLLKNAATAQDTLAGDGLSAVAAAFVGLPSPVAGLLRAGELAFDAAGQLFANPALEAWVTDAAQRTLLAMVKADQPNESWDVPSAVAEVVRQMVAGSEYVPFCAIDASQTASPLYASPAEANAGTGVLIIGIRGPTYAPAENAFAEQVRLTVTDAATPGAEAWAARGAVVASGPWAWDWPKGSGAFATFPTCDPAAQGVNLLADGSFEAWDGTPSLTAWTGTDVTRMDAAGMVYNEQSGETRYAVKLGSGATPGQVTQAVTVQPNTVYGLGFWARLVDGSGFVNPTTVTARLYDPATGGNVGAVVYESKWTSADTDWHGGGAAVVTPRTLPPVVRLKIFPTSSAKVIVDAAFLFPLTPLYLGGPYFGVARGSRDWQVGDGFEAAITNDRAGAAYGFTWQAVFDRWFGTRASSLYLPSSETPTIPDSLIAVP